jgi:hypothetical protein
LFEAEEKNTMGTNYITEKAIRFEELLDGRLATYGIVESPFELTTEDERRLRDASGNYVWVYRSEDGHLATMSVYSSNNGEGILGAIAETFDTVIYSEYEPQYHGYETQEAWDEAMSAEETNAADDTATTWH